MKYRQLTYQEFDLLKDDFKDYLYSKRLNTFEWKVLQDQNSAEALLLLEKYSDFAFEKVFQNIEYLEERSSNQLKVTYFSSSLALTIGVIAPPNSKVDFTDFSCLENLNSLDLGGFRCFKFDKDYQEGREEEIFERIENGAYVVDACSFNFLKVMRQSYQN